MTFETADRP